MIVASYSSLPPRIRRLARCFASLLGLAFAVASPAFAELEPAKSGPESIFAREDLWPYRVELTEVWDAGGRLARPLRAGMTGVLIRLEDAERARIDFGRSGLHVVPVDKTDLVARMEKTLRGEIEKEAPNLIAAIGARLATSETLPPSMMRFEAVEGYERFLCIYFDAAASESEVQAIRSRIAAIVQDRPDLLTVLFPIGERKDASMAALLQAVGWQVPFMLDHLAEPYAHGLVGEDMELPMLQLTSAEGRLWLEGGLVDDTLEELRLRLGKSGEIGEIEGRRERE